MKRDLKSGAAQRVLGPKAFAAISAVEGLHLRPESKRRLKALQADKTLSAADRRAAILAAYKAAPSKK